jgi:4-hydroxy-2-oxoheptanedioate aldolase
VVRPANAEPALLKKLCDVGAQTFLVPMIETAGQAADAVGAVRYPPRGIRGLGTSMARAAHWNAVQGYIDRADDEMCVIVQAESAVAMRNIEAIAEVDGVDAVFIGPSDLSASMGHAGKVSHPEVVAAVSDGIRRIVGSGKHAGVLCLDEKLIGEYTDCGADFVGVGVDTLLIGNAARTLAARFGNRQEESPTDAEY